MKIPALLRELHSHRWQDPEHRIVYEALAGVRVFDILSLREQLPAQATRMGFPDVDWTLYFAAGTGRNMGIKRMNPERSSKMVSKRIGELIAATAKQR